VLPVLFRIGDIPVPSYGVLVTVGLLAAFWVRRIEVARLGYDRSRGHAVIGFAALAGGIIGSKLGMLLFVSPAQLADLGLAALAGDLTGKTVVGGIAGGYLAVEAVKRVVGITVSTGDGFAVSLPLAQGIGRIGCFLHGCCGGVDGSGWLARLTGGHEPTQLYESALDLGLAATAWHFRTFPLPAGVRFKAVLVGYALVRFALEPFRGDPGWRVGLFTGVQASCLLAAGLLLLAIRRALTTPPAPSPPPASTPA
jgi:phosphatidylglycerol:prolipoprotein diacylglycerol transferase